MALRKKVITAILIILGALTMLLYGLARMSILEQFDAAEKEQMKRNVSLVVNTLDRTCQRLVQQASDYAWWDGMYDAVTNQVMDVQFAKETFASDTVTVDADLVIVYNLQRVPIYHHLIDQTDQVHRASVPFQPPTQQTVNKIVETFKVKTFKEISKEISKDASTTTELSERIHSGLAMVEGTPLLIALAPVLHSDATGTAQATLVLVKFFDQSVLPQIRNDTQLALRWQMAVPETTTRLYSLRCNGTQTQIDSQSIEISYAANGSVSGRITVNDLDGKPALSLYTTTDRTVYEQGQKSLQYMILGALIVGLFTCIVGYMFFENLVIKPVERIDQSVRDITANDRLGQRLSQEGVGEFGILANNINNMLASQELAQRSLLESEARFRSMVENAPEAIIVIDSEHDSCVEVNPKALQLFGYGLREQMINLLIYDLLSAKQPGGLTAKEFVAQQNEVLWRDGASTFEATIRRSDHDEVPCEVRLVILPGEERTLLRASLTDISDRKAIEARALQTQKLESLGLLAGGIAHDFNNLLTGILGQSSLALRKLPAESNVRGNIEKAITSAQHAATITRQLLDYAGRGSARHEQFELNKLVADTANLLESALPKQVQLHINLCPTLPYMEGDPGQIQQVVMNIATNAVQAIPEEQAGSVYLTTKTVLIEQDASYSFIGNQQITPGLYLCLEIADTGIGMDRTTLERIFDPFFTKKRTGTGLGLSSTLGIVGAHQGGLQVQSQPNYGTVFKVFFPASAQQPTVPAETTSPVNQATTQARILIIDDQQSVRDTVRDILESSGMHVLEAENGQAGFDLFQTRCAEIDAVMIDMRMPVMNGVETLTALRAIRPEIKAILSSGFNDVEPSQTLLRQGEVAFLPKPYESVKLIETLHKLLNVERG